MAIKSKLKIFTFGLGTLALLIMLKFFRPEDGGLFPPCPFHEVSGLYCPGCGTLRGLNHLLNADIPAAFASNPLMVIFLPFISYALLAEVFHVFLSIKFPVVRLKSCHIWAIFFIIVGFGVARNIPVHPFSLLAPH